MEKSKSQSQVAPKRQLHQAKHCVYPKPVTTHTSRDDQGTITIKTECRTHLYDFRRRRGESTTNVTFSDRNDAAGDVIDGRRDGRESLAFHNGERDLNESRDGRDC